MRSHVLLHTQLSWSLSHFLKKLCKQRRDMLRQSWCYEIRPYSFHFHFIANLVLRPINKLISWEWSPREKPGNALMISKFWKSKQNPGNIGRSNVFVDWQYQILHCRGSVWLEIIWIIKNSNLLMYLKVEVLTVEFWGNLKLKDKCFSVY